MNTLQPSAEQRTWQHEADLLAEGRELVERMCESTRYRYLYPDGPSVALLLSAYQEFDRLRTVGRIRGRARRQRRAFRALIRRHVRSDALGRSHRLSHRYPAPRLRRLPQPPQIVRRALAHVDPDARAIVEAHVGMESMRLGMTLSQDTVVAASGAAARGIDQFREALLNEALAHPDSIRGLHSQHLYMLSSAPPSVRRHPIATLLFVKLPLQMLLGLFMLLTLGYFGAYVFFNDERLGDFVSERVSGLLEGDLQMQSIHWRPRLIFDLVTGTPSPVTVRGVTVWSPYKSTGHGRDHQAAHAEELDAKIVLHEIIPWNRLGIPSVIDIPWVLHFTEVRSEAPMWFDIAEYSDTLADGSPTKYLSLTNAFALRKPGPPGRRGLSFAVDDAQIAQTSIDIDFLELSRWRAVVELERGRFGLTFEAPAPEIDAPVELPFTFVVSGVGSSGQLQIDDIDIPLGAIQVTDFSSNTPEIPAGDLAYSLVAEAAGSSVAIDGSLRDMFPRLHDTAPPAPARVDLMAHTDDADGIMRHILDEFDLPPQTVVAKDSEVDATVTGLLSDPIYTLAARGLSLDLLEEPAWVADDVEVRLTLATSEIPQMWSDRFDAGDSRDVILIDTFEGVALDGTFALAPRESPPAGFEDEASGMANIVLPFFEEDAYLISLPLQVSGINPAQLVPEDPRLGQTLSGVADGGVDLRRLVLGANPDPQQPSEGTALLRAEIEFDDLRIQRDPEPAQRDGMPRDAAVSGLITMDAEQALDFGQLVVTTPGASLRANGGVRTEVARLDELLLELRIDDGQAFARSFSIPSYFDTLRARALAQGSLASPSASRGTLSVGNLSIGDLINTGNTTEASFIMKDGRLKLRVDTSDARLFGGQGKVSAEIDVFDRGTLSAAPKIRATASLTGVDLAELSNGVLEGRADVELEVGDGEGHAAPLPTLRVWGEASSKALQFGGSTYRGATVAFGLNQDEVAIERLVLPIHRPVSPHFASDVTVPIGELVAEGTLTLEGDPQVDLLVQARGVPISSVTRLLQVDGPIYGQVAEGTEFSVGGTLSRPRVDGRVALEGLSASGVALGAGVLDITSEDYAAEGPLAAHREVRVHGELHQGDGPAPIQWLVDSVVAIGEPASETQGPSIEAQLDVEFDRVTIATLLRDPVDPRRSPAVEGELREVSAHVLACAGGTAMLSDCIDVVPPPEQDFSVGIEFAVQGAWMRSSTEALPAAVAPCQSPTTLCSDGALAATVEWPIITLSQPWKIRTGGDDEAQLTLAGVFDLSSPPPSAAPSTASQGCTPPPLAAASTTAAASDGLGNAQIEGTVDLEPLAAIARTYGVDDMRGRLDLNVDVAGRILDPEITGRASLASSGGSGSEPLVVQLGAISFPLEFRDLRLRMIDGWLVTDGDARIRGGDLRFGSVRGTNTGYGLTGPCAGHFALATEGRLSANLVAEVLGDPIVAGPGGVDLRELHVGGYVGATTELRELRGSLGFDRNALNIEFSEGITSAQFDRGRIDFRRCGSDCAFGDTGWYAIDIGGGPASETAVGEGPPPTALRMTAGTRGRAAAWGRAYIDPAFERSAGVDLQVQLDDIPYRSFDSNGRPVYEVEVTSNDLRLRGGTPLVATGNAEIDRARYVKDAVQGVEILAFTDNSPEIAAAPPELLQGMTFDIRVETDRPFRIENNVASGLQADAVVEVTGTYEDPEFTGRLDIEPGGTVDIPFLTGTYEIQRGRVTLLRELQDAEVDMLALRNEPIYIDDQPRSVQLLLGGTLSAIRWSCITDAGGGELDTVRGCTEYLVLGAGDVQLTENDVQQFGAGGLAGVRKPLQVVGHLTEFDVGQRAAEAAPRLGPYVPDVRLRLGQIGPELEIATPTDWLDFDYGRATFGWDYTRGYPGFLLRQSREATVKLELLDPITIQYSRRTRSYLNERVIFDPLEQRSLELRFDFRIPTLR